MQIYKRTIFAFSLAGFVGVVLYFSLYEREPINASAVDAINENPKVVEGKPAEKDFQNTDFNQASVEDGIEKGPIRESEERKFQDIFSGAKLKKLAGDGPMAVGVRDFNINDYLNKPVEPRAAFNLYKAHYLCRTKFIPVSSDICKKLEEYHLPSEYESLKAAADGGYVTAQLEFPNYLPVNHESFSQDEVDEFRKSSIEYLKAAWASGSVRALAQLSSTYFYGQGVEVNFNRAYFYSKTAQIIFEEYSQYIPIIYKNHNQKIVQHLEAVLYPYQKGPILKEVYAQKNSNCCIFIF
ncbi:SEL1-like repeat protein [Microbulbifer sp. 2201CG32-9]|uniref:hypothetical protein n=1 Tax=Microbulbifer sp. 2201CG32-9 TaxID=3232309 RepID=UPI00345C1CC8